MRPDIFDVKKSVHLKLKKETHIALREKLVRHGVSIQDLFQHYAEIIIEDSPRSERIIQKIVNKKIKDLLEKKKNNRKNLPIGDLDSETLYNLLEEADKKEYKEDEE